MTRGLLLIMALFVLGSVNSQEISNLDQVRNEFQSIRDGDDIEQFLKVTVDQDDPDATTIKAYQAAATCMMAEYVFSPLKKLKYFNQGKGDLERLIEQEKTVESVYCRLLVQLNVPKILNYYKEIEGDIDFLKSELPAAKIDLDYKNTIIKNLVTLASEDEIKNSLLGIDLTGKQNKT